MDKIQSIYNVKPNSMAKEKTKRTTQITSLSIPAIPIKITFEVIIRDERESGKENTGFLEKALPEATTNCPDNQFHYSFETDGATPLFLKIEAFEKNKPGSQGDFTTCINDISNDPEIAVIALARRDHPGGRAELTLKFLGKDVFSSPKELTYGANGLLGINETVKLPK